MDKEFTTSEKFSSRMCIEDVKVKLLEEPERYKEFEELVTKCKEGKIPKACFVLNMKYLFNGERNNQEPNFQNSEDVYKKSLFEDSTIHAGVGFVNRVIKGLENHPHELSKFFYMMENYRNDLDEEKLKHWMCALFESCPEQAELKDEFMQFITEEPKSVEDIMERYHKKMFDNCMVIYGMQKAIDSTLKLLDECVTIQRGAEVKVRRYLSCRNLEDIRAYCNVDLMTSRPVQKSAYVVVGELSFLLELRKKHGDVIRRKMNDEVEKFVSRKNQERRMHVMSDPRTMSERVIRPTSDPRTTMSEGVIGPITPSISKESTQEFSSLSF